MIIIVMIMIASIEDFILNITLKCYCSNASMISMNKFFVFSQSEGG